MISLIEVIEGSGLGYGVYPMIAKRKLYPLLISRMFATQRLLNERSDTLA